MSNSLDPDQAPQDVIWVQTVCKSYQQATLVGKQIEYQKNDLQVEKPNRKYVQNRELKRVDYICIIS